MNTITGNLTPTDEPVPIEAPKKVPKRGLRKRVLGAGEGDYRIYEIADKESGMPQGALLPTVAPPFQHTAMAMKWIRNESGDLLAGKQVMILKATEVLNLRVATRSVVAIECKPKVVVNDPTKQESI